ncbi:putative ABC transport system ATP-binding protein [Lachnospiraceae bacterium]|nr:putative ABC transport system ATP-binding protein [Lachnospiraceae bacterium]
MKILEIKNLCKVYGDGETKVDALKNITFDVEQGEFVAIVGPSGSGKSTLMHILGGVDRPTSGEVIISGVDVGKLNETKLAIFRRRQIGLIYQFYNLIPILNVEENMTLPILLDGKKPDKALLRDLVGKLGLTERLKHLPNQLSGGQQQRVSIGRALMNHPALLLADEPTGNLDTENSKEIVSLLRKFNRENKQTVIIITHDDRIALSADRVITIEDGLITRDSKDKYDQYRLALDTEVSAS